MLFKHSFLHIYLFLLSKLPHFFIFIAKSPGGSLYKIMDKDALFAAAIARDADAIAALEMHADKVSGDSEETILHTESENGNTEHVRFILREFAHKNLLVKLDLYKRSALHLASYKGHTEVAEILINAATHLLPPSPHDDNIDDDNPVTSFQAFLRQADKYYMQTALHKAVKKGNVALVKLLVEADTSDKHIQDDQGKTPMYIAVKEGLNDIAEVISTTCIAPSLLGPHCSMVVRDKTLVQGMLFNESVSFHFFNYTGIHTLLLTKLYFVPFMLFF